jgi:hypothetical protein
MYVYDKEGLSRRIRDSSMITPGTTFLIEPTGHLLWVYIFGDERADSDLKNTASAIAQTVMQEDLEFSIITVSFLLPGKLIERKPRRDIIIPEERGRGRDVTIHRDQLLELQTDRFIQNLAFDPDVKVLEEEIRRSGIIPECVEFAVELYFRFKANVSIYPDPSYFYTDSDMRTCAFTIFDILFGKDLHGKSENSI